MNEHWPHPSSSYKVKIPFSLWDGDSPKHQWQSAFLPQVFFKHLAVLSFCPWKECPLQAEKLPKGIFLGKTFWQKASLPSDWPQSWAKILVLASRFQHPFVPLGSHPSMGQSAQSHVAALNPTHRPRTFLLLPAEGGRAPGPSWGNRPLRLSFLWQCFPPACQLPPFPGFPWWRLGKRWERKTSIYSTPSIYVPVVFHDLTNIMLHFIMLS